jgi:hypothetical protein
MSGSGSGSGRNGAVVRRYIRSKEPRMRWSADLHRSFLQAIDCLGGQHSTFSFLLFIPSSYIYYAALPCCNVALSFFYAYVVTLPLRDSVELII